MSNNIVNNDVKIVINNLIENVIRTSKWNTIFDGTSLLKNREIIRWCYESYHNSNTEEKVWGNNMLNQYCGYTNSNLSQWTSKLGEAIVKEALQMLGEKNIKEKESIRSSTIGVYRVKTYQPDLVTDDSIFEVKTRNWTTSGTAGEKILGVSKKYGELPYLTNKPLFVVCVAYQEYECREKFACGNIFEPLQCTPYTRDILLCEKNHNIHIMPFTQLLEALGYEYGCWD